LEAGASSAIGSSVPSASARVLRLGWQLAACSMHRAYMRINHYASTCRCASSGNLPDNSGDSAHTVRLPEDVSAGLSGRDSSRSICSRPHRLTHHPLDQEQTRELRDHATQACITMIANNHCPGDVASLSRRCRRSLRLRAFRVLVSANPSTGWTRPYKEPKWSTSDHDRHS
jgi:hypothetical protein